MYGKPTGRLGKVCKIGISLFTSSFRVEFKYCSNSAESIGIARGETCSAVNPTFLKNTCGDLASGVDVYVGATSNLLCSFRPILDTFSIGLTCYHPGSGAFSWRFIGHMHIIYTPVPVKMSGCRDFITILSNCKKVYIISTPLFDYQARIVTQ